MKTIFDVLVAALFIGFAFDLWIRHQLRKQPENKGFLRAFVRWMRVRQVAALGLLVIGPALLVTQRNPDVFWIVFGVTIAVLLPLIFVVVWFNVELSRLFRRKAE